MNFPASASNLDPANLDPTILAQAAWCVMDMETASKREGSVCEIAVIWRDAQGTKLGEYATLVKLPPGFGFSAQFTQLHGITKKMTADSPDLQAVMAELEPCLRDVRILAHNSDFEIGHLRGAKQEYAGMRIPKQAQFIDTLRMSRYTHPKEQRHKLADLAKRYDIPYSSGEAHRAAHDAQVLDAWFLEYATRHHNGNFTAALADYDRRPATEGSYQWWLSHQPPRPASQNQLRFANDLVAEGYLASHELAATPNNMDAYSKLLDQGIARRDRGQPAPKSQGGSGTGCMSLASLATWLFRKRD